MLTRVTDTIIEELILSTCGATPDSRYRHLFSHALHGLVRVAQAEQLQQLRMDVARAIGGSSERIGPVVAPQHPHQDGDGERGAAIDQPVGHGAMPVWQEALNDFVQRSHQGDGQPGLDAALLGTTLAAAKQQEGQAGIGAGVQDQAGSDMAYILACARNRTEDQDQHVQHDGGPVA